MKVIYNLKKKRKIHLLGKTIKIITDISNI
jgi:hypothetical protein